ncbi:hypothetical protein FAVG1_00320 [Fusarium avenaceum]|nr:hypothetical protein FAVG1_00320 [Fusarium avenaceum]
MVDGQQNRGRTQAEPGSLADLERQKAALDRQIAEAREGSRASNSAGDRAPSASSTRRGGNNSGRSGSGFGHGASRSRQPSSSSRGGRGGISRNRQNRPVRTVISDVPEAERREVINEHGDSRLVVVNTSFTGGDNNRFVAPTFSGGYMGRTPNVQDIAAVANRVKQSAGVSHVSFQVEPDYNDMHEFKHNKRVTERVTASNGRIRPGRTANSGLTADTRISVVSERRGKLCDLCRSETHSLAHCIFAPRGYIMGCPLCNSRTHQVDHCSEYKKLKMEEKVKLLISDRARLPALQTDESWTDLLWRYLQREDSVVPTGYPWSEGFAMDESCKDSCRAYLKIQEQFDKDGDIQKLGFDEATKDLKAINMNYWDQNKDQRPWTDRLAQLALTEDDEVLTDAPEPAPAVTTEPQPQAKPLPVRPAGSGIESAFMKEAREEREKEDEIDYSE